MLINLDKLIEYGTLIVAILAWFSPMWQTFHANKETKRNDKNNQKDFDVEQEINFYKAKFDDLSDKYNQAIEKARQADLLINKIQRKLTFKNKQLSSYQKKLKKFRQVLFYLGKKFTDKDRKMLNEKLKEFDDDDEF